MNKILLFILLVVTVNCFSQNNTEYSGYYIRKDSVFFQTDSVIKFSTYNIVFLPKKAIKQKKIKKICEYDFKRLHRYGEVYNVLPKRYNLSILSKIYDSLAVSSIINDFKKNSECLSFVPTNISNFVDISKIKFGGEFKVLKRDDIIFNFVEYKDNGKMSDKIEINIIKQDDKKKIFEEKNLTKKRFIFFKLYNDTIHDGLLYNTIMLKYCQND